MRRALGELSLEREKVGRRLGRGAARVAAAAFSARRASAVGRMEPKSVWERVGSRTREIA